MRLMSDAYGKGIVRAQVENTNLRAYATQSDVTSAESFKTCPAVSFFGQNYVDVVENLNDAVCQICGEDRGLRKLHCGCIFCFSDLLAYCETLKLDQDKLTSIKCPGNC